MVAVQSPDLARFTVRGLILGAVVSLLVVWTAHALVPDAPTPGAPVGASSAPPPPPAPTDAEAHAITQTLVVLPLLVLFHLFEWTGAILILIFVVVVTTWCIYRFRRKPSDDAFDGGTAPPPAGDDPAIPVEYARYHYTLNLRYWLGETMIRIDGARRRKVVVDGQGSMLKIADGAHFGSFHPITGAAIEDNDSVGMASSGAENLQVSEGSGSVVYSLRLSSRPGRDVVVSLNGGGQLIIGDHLIH